jgi:hypothetical protein
MVVGNREVILNGFFIDSFYIFEWNVPIRLFRVIQLNRENICTLRTALGCFLADGLGRNR